jgi:hypothetical protein
MFHELMWEVAPLKNTQVSIGPFNEYGVLTVAADSQPCGTQLGQLPQSLGHDWHVSFELHEPSPHSTGSPLMI